MSENKEFSSNKPQNAQTTPLPQMHQTEDEKGILQQPSRRRIFPKNMEAHLQAARTLLQQPTPRTSSFAPVENIEDALPPQDVTLEAAKWTRRRDIPLAILAWTAVILLIFWFASHVTGTILVIVIASLLAYALAPLVILLERVMPRVLAVIIVYVVVLAGIGTLLYFVVSSAVNQLSAFTHSVGTFIAPAHPGQATPLEQILQPFGITPTQIGSFRDQLLTQLGGVANSIVPLLTGVAGALLNIILVIILSIYLLFNGSRVATWLQTGVPHNQRGRIRFLLHTMQRIVGGYIRGQLIMSTLIGILVGVGMLIFRVPYALLLGVLAFLLEFIPVLGTLTSGFFCVLVALSNGWISALLVLGYFVLVHIFEGDIVGPRIVGKAVGLSPMVALIALAAGLELFGVGGALFAAPIAGVLQALIVTIWSEWREAHPEQFLQLKQQAAQKVAENSADHSIEPEPPEKLLS
ncbi:MAG TPA: AI-2E family transporter [Ktedonobacteraceae bacterium]